jgi:hypothetical protein
MTTKTEMTLEKVCFMYDGSKEAKECIRIMNESYKALFEGKDKFVYWIAGGIADTFYKEESGYTKISPSDYLLLLTAPESQAHLLTERSEPCGNCKETIKECACMRNICFKCNKPVGNITFSVCDECWNILHPPKNNSAKELLASQPPVMEGKKETLQDVIKRVSPFGTMTISNPKMLIALEDFIGQKTSSLQSEVEQLKGALQELVDIQNGPPLEQHKNEWQEVMDKCYSILSK